MSVLQESEQAWAVAGRGLRSQELAVGAEFHDRHSRVAWMLMTMNLLNNFHPEWARAEDGADGFLDVEEVRCAWDRRLKVGSILARCA